VQHKSAQQKQNKFWLHDDDLVLIVRCGDLEKTALILALNVKKSFPDNPEELN